MSPQLLAALRADFNPKCVGILWDPRGRWFATTPRGEVIEAPSAEGLRRALRALDGSAYTDTTTMPAYDPDSNNA